MNTNSHKTTALLALTLLSASVFGGEWTDRYWPMECCDQKSFIYEQTKVMTINTCNSEICVDSEDASECLRIYCNSTGCYLSSAEAMGTTVTFSPPVLLVNDAILQNGGTVKTITTATQPGLDPYPATYTVTVAKVASVTVPAGTYTDCRSLTATEVATIPGYGTIRASALTAYLAPAAGIIKTLVRPNDWATMTDGTVCAVDVHCLAAPSRFQLSIHSPKSSQRLSNVVATVVGGAGNTAAWTGVFYRINDSTWQPVQTANNWSNWNADVNLRAGSNVFSVFAMDTCNRTSPTQTLSLMYVVSDRLTVVTNGQGMVAPDYSSQLLEIGKSYALTATPQPGYVFCGWTGGMVTNSPKLSLVMQSNLVVQANFIPNPFMGAKGTYQGLFYPETNRTAQNSGSLIATVSDKGQFTAKVQAGGKSYSGTGRLSCEGATTLNMNLAGAPTLRVSMTVDLSGGDKLQGQVTDGNWTADLAANRATFSSTSNQAPQMGKYTLVLPGDDGSSDSPGGESFATVTVDAGGKVQLMLSLAEGTKITQSGYLSRQGRHALYSPAYTGQGMLLGWLTFTNTDTDDVNGTVDWIKPAQQTAKYYPAGFAVRTEAAGSKYVPPPTGTRVIDRTASEVWFANGNLNQSFTNQITLGADNKITNLSSNKLILTVVLPSGLFNGTVNVPGTTRSIPLHGVFNQKRTAAYGFFLGADQTGRVGISE